VEALDEPRAVRGDVDDAEPRATLPRDQELRAHAAAPPRAHERPPAALILAREEEQLDGAPAAVPREDARRDHSRVVDDHAVARTQELREDRKSTRLNSSHGSN